MSPILLCLVPFRGTLRAHIGPSAPSLSDFLSAHAGHVSASPPGPSPGTKAQERKKMEYCDSEMLNRAMRNAGIRNGFDEIQAEFSAFRDFKLRT